MVRTVWLLLCTVATIGSHQGEYIDSILLKGTIYGNI